LRKERTKPVGTEVRSSVQALFEFPSSIFSADELITFNECKRSCILRKIQQDRWMVMTSL